HGLADEIFAQHRAERSAPVAAARIGGSTGTLQLNLAPGARAIPRLPQQNGPAVAELRDEVSELMTGIGHCDGLQTLRDDISGKDPCQLIGSELADIEAQLQTQRVIEFQK